MRSIGEPIRQQRALANKHISCTCRPAEGRTPGQSATIKAIRHIFFDDGDSLPKGFSAGRGPFDRQSMRCRAARKCRNTKPEHSTSQYNLPLSSACDHVGGAVESFSPFPSFACWLIFLRCMRPHTYTSPDMHGKHVELYKQLKHCLARAVKLLRHWQISSPTNYYLPEAAIGYSRSISADTPNRREDSALRLAWARKLQHRTTTTWSFVHPSEEISESRLYHHGSDGRGE